VVSILAYQFHIFVTINNLNKMDSFLNKIILFITAMAINFALIGQQQQIIELVYPKNGFSTDSTSVSFQWAENYSSLGSPFRFQLATDIQFTEMLKDSIVNAYGLNLPILQCSSFYWKVIDVSTGLCSTINSFKSFTPACDSSVVLWLHLDSNVVVSSGSISLVPNLIDNYLTSATQSVLSQQPLLIPNALNQKSAMRYDGNDALRFALSATNFSGFSFFGVVSTGTSKSSQEVYLASAMAPGSRWAMGVGSHPNEGAGWCGPSSNINMGNADHVSVNRFAQLSYIKDLTKWQLFSGGNFIRNVFDASMPNYTGVHQWAIGSENGTAYPLTGDISEIVISNVTMNQSQRNAIEDYMRYRYFPPANLGPDKVISENSFCGNISLSPGNYFYTYLWSNGSTSSVINVAAPGTYWVSVTDQFGYASADTIEILPPKSLQYPLQNQICANSSLTWSPSYSAGSYSFLWSNGATTPSLTITQAGTYFVTISDGFGCSYQSDPLTLTIDNYEYLPYLGADTSLCTGNYLALQAGASETVSYSWPNGSTGNQYAVSTPGTYWVQTTNANGCIARDTINITIAGTAPNAEFTVQDHCEGFLAPVVDQSVGVGTDVIASWQWSMGNGTVINQQNPNYTYPLAGTYPVQLYVQSLGGCGAYHYDTIEVFSNPTAAYSFIGHCDDQEVQFTDGSQVGGAPIATYAWNFDMPATGAYNTSNIPIPNRIFDQVGSYDVKLVVTDGNGCKDSILQTVQIDPSPLPNFIFESTCQGSPIQFLNTSSTQPSSTYLWDFGDNTTSILVNPQHTYPDYGINSVSLQITNLYNCSATVNQNVEVYAFPLTSLQLGAACMDSYVTLENTSDVPLGAIDSTLWVINHTDTLYGMNAAWMVNGLGQQQVELFTWSAQGCTAQTSQFFDVNEQFNASFSTYPGIIAAGQPFTFENTSTPGSIALWTFGDGGFSTDFSPEHTFDAQFADSTLSVLLVALSPSGCVDSSYQEVLIQRARIDLEISNLFLQKDGNWYVMGVKLKNKGTVDLTGADLLVETPKGLLFNETWNGTLKPTEDSIYVFSAMPTSIFTDQDAIESYVCVSGQAHDLYGTLETYLDNNKVCRNVEGESIVLLPVFPNPIYKDFVVRIYLTNAAEVFLSLDDERGRSAQIMETGATLQPGYYEYAVDTDKLAEGTYFINLRSVDETKSFKLAVVK